MAFVHGKSTVITVATKDISPYTKTSSQEVKADVHDTTGYGATAHTKAGGLLDSTFTCGGTYDNTVSVGPRNALLTLVGTTCAITRKPEGSGTGKPLDTYSGILTKFVETNPVDDMVTWSADFEGTGPIVTTAQP